MGRLIEIRTGRALYETDDAEEMAAASARAEADGFDGRGTVKLGDAEIPESRCVIEGFDHTQLPGEPVKPLPKSKMPKAEPVPSEFEIVNAETGEVVAVVPPTVETEHGEITPEQFADQLTAQAKPPVNTDAPLLADADAERKRKPTPAPAPTFTARKR